MTKSEREANKRKTGAWFIRLAKDKDLGRPARKPRLKVVREK